MSPESRSPEPSPWEVRVNPSVSSRGLSMEASDPLSQLPATKALRTQPAEIINAGCEWRPSSPLTPAQLLTVHPVQSPERSRRGKECGQEGRPEKDLRTRPVLTSTAAKQYSGPRLQASPLGHRHCLLRPSQQPYQDGFCS